MWKSRRSCTSIEEMPMFAYTFSDGEGFIRVKTQGKVVEPSRMCLEASAESLVTVQGVVLWTAMYALWLYRCDVQFGRQQKEQKGYMTTWHTVLKDWGRREQISMEVEQVTRVQQAITAWMAQRRRIQQMQEPGIKQ